MQRLALGLCLLVACTETGDPVEPEPTEGEPVCCLCHVPGTPPAWCGPPVKDAEACEQIGDGLEAEWSEWYDECELDEDGVCLHACE